MTSSVQSSQASQIQLATIASQLSSQLQALQSTESQLSSLFGSMVSSASSTAIGSAVSSSSGRSSSADSAPSATGFSTETLSALLAATNAATGAASAATEAFTAYGANSAASPPTVVNAAGTARLLSIGTNDTSSDKPDMAEFMAATGTDPATASELLYGSIGSNQDLRDWSAIMNSDNPLADARASTAAMYNSNLAYTSTDAQKPLSVVASTQNLALIATTVASTSDPSKTVDRYDVALTDGQGNILRIETDPSKLADDMTNFGINHTQLIDLANRLKGSEVNWQTEAWFDGLEA